MQATGDYYPTVHEFYAFWQAYATPKPFAWADKYDVRDVCSSNAASWLEHVFIRPSPQSAKQI
jgi:hypothetical protein